MRHLKEKCKKDEMMKHVNNSDRRAGICEEMYKEALTYHPGAN